MNKELIDKINHIYWKYTTGKQIVTTSQHLAVLTSMCSFGKNVNRGPIAVAKSLLNNEEITLIMLGGTQIKEGQATGFKESKLSAYGKDNDYLIALLNLFKSKDKDGKYIIPKDKPLLITGISLGGMIAQQLLSKEEIKNNYQIKSIICFGSPLVKPLDRKNIRVKRFCDRGDIVPKMETISVKLNKSKKTLDKEEKIIENGGYKTKIESHALSYVSNKCWDKYDFYGDRKGTNTLELLEEIKFYDAPTIENKK